VVVNIAQEVALRRRLPLAFGARARAETLRACPASV
jgi:hypothetical protein